MLNSREKQTWLWSRTALQLTQLELNEAFLSAHVLIQYSECFRMEEAGRSAIQSMDFCIQSLNEKRSAFMRVQRASFYFRQHVSDRASYKKQWIFILCGIYLKRSAQLNLRRVSSYPTLTKSIEGAPPVWLSFFDTWHSPNELFTEVMGLHRIGERMEWMCCFSFRIPKLRKYNVALTYWYSWW